MAVEALEKNIGKEERRGNKSKAAAAAAVRSLILLENVMMLTTTGSWTWSGLLCSLTHSRLLHVFPLRSSFSSSLFPFPLLSLLLLLCGVELRLAPAGGALGGNRKMEVEREPFPYNFTQT